MAFKIVMYVYERGGRARSINKLQFSTKHMIMIPHINCNCTFVWHFEPMKNHMVNDSNKQKIVSERDRERRRRKIQFENMPNMYECMYFKPSFFKKQLNKPKDSQQFSLFYFILFYTRLFFVFGVCYNRRRKEMCFYIKNLNRKYIFLLLFV